MRKDGGRVSTMPATQEDLAFAGAARIAELVRAKEVSPSELVELYLERISRIDPELNAYRVVLGEQARADAKRAEERLAAGEEAPLLGVPVAIKDNVDYAGEVTTQGTAAYGEPASGGQRGRAPAARRGRRDPRQDQPARARHLRLHREPHLGRHAESVGPLANSRRLEWGKRRRGRRRPVRDRPRHGWRRFDSLPGRQLRPLRIEAAAQPRLPLTRSRALARPLGLRLRQQDRDGHGALPRCGERSREGRLRDAAALRASPGRSRANPARASCGSRARPRRSSRCPRRPR